MTKLLPKPVKEIFKNRKSEEGSEKLLVLEELFQTRALASPFFQSPQILHNSTPSSQNKEAEDFYQLKALMLKSPHSGFSK